MSQVSIGKILYSPGGYTLLPADYVLSVVDHIRYPDGRIQRPAKGYHFQIQGVFPDNWGAVQQKLARCESMVEFNFRFNGGNSYVDVHLTDEKDITWLRLAIQ